MATGAGPGGLAAGMTIAMPPTASLKTPEHPLGGEAGLASRAFYDDGPVDEAGIAASIAAAYAQVTAPGANPTALLQQALDRGTRLAFITALPTTNKVALLTLLGRYQPPVGVTSPMAGRLMFAVGDVPDGEPLDVLFFNVAV